MRVHADHRRIAYCDLFPEGTPNGDLNVFVFNEGARTFWHRHQKQTDRFFVAKGLIVVSTTSGPGQPVTEHTLAEGDWLVIPPNTWHGYECLLHETVVVMYLDQKYNPDDEERMDEAAMLTHV
jgi:quercetin dioxygenase-like cupin family protein